MAFVPWAVACNSCFRHHHIPTQHTPLLNTHPHHTPPHIHTPTHHKHTSTSNYEVKMLSLLWGRFNFTLVVIKLIMHDLSHFLYYQNNPEKGHKMNLLIVTLAQHFWDHFVSVNPFSGSFPYFDPYIDPKPGGTRIWKWRVCVYLRTKTGDNRCRISWKKGGNWA